VIAGVMKEPLWRFVLIVTLAKGGRNRSCDSHPENLS
jgi:membrane protein YqaA with SNARE-associated domain